MGSKLAPWIPEDIDFREVLSVMIDRRTGKVIRIVKAYSRVEADLSKLPEERRWYYWTTYRVNPAKHHYGWRRFEDVDWSRMYFMTADADEERRLIEDLKNDGVEYRVVRVKG